MGRSASLIRFESYREALAYYQANKDFTPDGTIMSISTNGREVRVRQLHEPEPHKRSRHGEAIGVRGIITDALPGGINGMFSHADGRRYDSKSVYERSVRAKGCRVVGNDLKNTEWKTPLERGVRGDFNVRPQLQDAVNKVLHG